MATFRVDLSKATSNLSEWPNEFVEATVDDAKIDISKSSGEPMLVLELEVYHPDHGSAKIRDYLPSGFESKSKAFYQAFNRLSNEEVNAETEIDIDPDNLTGGTVIVKLGEQEVNGKIYKRIDAPWYLADTRTDVLNYLDK